MYFSLIMISGYFSISECLSVWGYVCHALYSVSQYINIWVTLYLGTSLSGYLYICVPLYLGIYIWVFLSRYLYIYLGISISGYISIWVSQYMTVSLYGISVSWVSGSLRVSQYNNIPIYPDISRYIRIYHMSGPPNTRFKGSWWK